MTGQLQGGWEYIYASYALTWLFFAAYTFSLYVRAKKAIEQAEDTQQPSGGDK